MQTIPPALAPLAAYRQWILWRCVPREGKKPLKLPINWMTAAAHDAHDPTIWLDAPTALALAQVSGPEYGVGFVLTAEDPFFCIDLDSCRIGNEWNATAKQLCGAFAGAAMEVSHSGQGLHIIASYETCLPHSCRGANELYTQDRFIALTGINAVGDAGSDHTATLARLVPALWAPTEAAAPGPDSGPRADWCGPADDAEILRRAMRSKGAGAAFGGKASFADLWDADAAVLSTAYPSASGEPYDASSADRALAQHLAFWTGCDAARIDRLMRQSALARAKWDQHASYMDRTIGGACAVQKDVLKDPKVDDTNQAAAAPTGGRFLTVEHQQALFAGCVYVEDQHRVLVPGGRLLKPDQFKVAYGGHTFSMDRVNQRTSRDAWEAFTQSQAAVTPKVQTSVFRPAEPAGAITALRDGVSAVNTYWPVATPRAKGDIGRFLRHMAKMLPDQHDREVLLAYMAACVQHQGVKFQWAPVIQGIEGNGKTLLSRCVAEAIGARYTHWPKASKLTEKFNGWLFGKTFFAVEEIYTAGAKSELMEELKVLVTGDGLEIESKGIDQVAREICGNFMFTTNHMDAIRKALGDRRWCVMYTAQQAEGDLERDGMGGNYFPDLYDWLRGSGAYTGQPSGYSVITEFLHTYPIPAALNPARDCQRAPRTTSTDAAIGASLGVIEQHVQEAIEQDRPGFAGGWISSMAFGTLLAELRRDVPPRKRREMLRALGYDWHPGLPEGRVNNAVMPDNGKPRLFVRKGHPSANLMYPAEITRAYTAAQEPTKTVHQAPSMLGLWETARLVPGVVRQ